MFIEFESLVQLCALTVYIYSFLSSSVKICTSKALTTATRAIGGAEGGRAPADRPEPHDFQAQPSLAPPSKLRPTAHAPVACFPSESTVSLTYTCTPPPTGLASPLHHGADIPFQTGSCALAQVQLYLCLGQDFQHTGQRCLLPRLTVCSDAACATVRADGRCAEECRWSDRSAF